jgi:predicted neutral ceramidase superfamily lipid hydrolase
MIFKKTGGNIIFGIVLIAVSFLSLLSYLGKITGFEFIFNNYVLGVLITIVAVYHAFFAFKRFKFIRFLKKLVFDIIVIALALLPTFIEVGLLKGLSVNLVLEIPLLVVSILGLIYGGYCILDFIKKQYVVSP